MGKIYKKSDGFLPNIIMYGRDRKKNPVSGEKTLTFIKFWI